MWKECSSKGVFFLLLQNHDMIQQFVSYDSSEFILSISKHCFVEKNAFESSAIAISVLSGTPTSLNCMSIKVIHKFCFNCCSFKVQIDSQMVWPHMKNHEFSIDVGEIRN